MIEVRHEVPVVFHGKELGVVKSGTFIQRVDLGHVFLREIDLHGCHVLAKALRLGCLDQRDGISLHVPGKDDLRWGLALGRRKFIDHRICQRVQIHELVRSKLPMSRADGGVALHIDAPLAMEEVDLRLIEVWMDLNLIDGGSDTAASNKVGELWNDAVADTD